MTVTRNAGPGQAPWDRRPACPLTVIVGADPRDDDLVTSILAIQDGLTGIDAQIIVSCEEQRLDVPAGVELVPYPADGQGDRYDAASRLARGELLAFLDSRITFRSDWADEVLRVFEDPTVMIAGGPVVPQGRRRGQRVSAAVMTHYLGGAPAAHNATLGRSRPVKEVGSSNLVVRTWAFRAVGGFQTPAAGGGEAVRLCYKVRTLLSGTVTSEPGMTLTAPAPSVPGGLLHDIAAYGRSRGHLARRMPEAVPLVPYSLPSVISVLFCVTATLGIVIDNLVVRTMLLGVLIALMMMFIALSARTRRGSVTTGDRLLAGLALPLVLLVFGVTFLRGYLGPIREDISPPRERAAATRVLILNWRDVTHPWSGGAETYIHQLAKRWAADGMEVGWLTQRHSGSSRHEIIDRIHIYRVGGRLTLYARAAITYLTRLRGRYDIIVDCENGIPFFSPFYSRVPTVLVVHHVHQEIFRRQVPRQLRWLALWLEGSLMPWMYRKNQVVAVSEGTRADLVDLGFNADQICVVTNGVQPSRPTSSPPADEATILCMGRLKPQKSVDFLIRAMPAMVEQIPQLRVDVVGQGPDRRRLERLAWSLGMAGHIRFHGYVRTQVRDDLAAAAWIAVCPSSFEGWGVVCMEASARGLPVVASNVAGLRESVRDGETGVLVPYGDERALAETVVSLLGDPARRASMGAAGRDWAAGHTWDKSAAAFAELLTTRARPSTAPDPQTPLALASSR